jgi:uncharacterized metal-binding protein YceD (DUF177 family)
MCLPEGYGVVSPCFVSVRGQLMKAADSAKDTTQPPLILCEGEILAKLGLECDRCLESVEYELLVGFSEEIRHGTGSEPLNIASWVEENTILNIPRKVLCSEDCCGLCHICGANRNTEACVCERGTDTRFDALKGLFGDEGGERDGNLPKR